METSIKMFVWKFMMMIIFANLMQTTKHHPIIYVGGVGYVPFFWKFLIEEPT